MNNYLSSAVTLCAMLSALCDSLDRETGLLLRKKKELTDRALKLAEAGKSKSNWELQGILRVAAFVLGFLAGR
jgi:hypothetical protein